MRVLSLFAAALVAAAACSSEQVQSAPGCTDPCCGGNPALIDCGEHPSLSCVESGDPCTAQAYGCLGGAFFRMPQTSLPASCPAGDGGTDATAEGDATIEEGGLFSSDGGSSSSGDGATDASADGATADGALGDASADGAPDGAGDSALDAQDNGAVDAPGDAPPDAP
jgi:hypothetical protein